MPDSARKTGRLAGLALIVLVILLDQFSKYWLIDVVGIAQRPPIEVTSFFRLVMVWNHGVSFGMFSDSGSAAPYFLIGVALIIVGFLARWLYQSEGRLNSLAIGMVIGGALGNVCDRVRFGAVADFFDVYIASYHWPAFNVADSAIFLGVALLVWDGMMRRPPKESRTLNS